MENHVRVEQLAAGLKYGVDIKERRFRLKNYSATFLGSDAVRFLKEAENVSTSEAIKLGNLLIREKIFHHVCDDHLLQDGKLFYRFYEDELKISKEITEEKSEEKTSSSSSTGGRTLRPTDALRAACRPSGPSCRPRRASDPRAGTRAQVTRGGRDVPAQPHDHSVPGQ